MKKTICLNPMIKNSPIIEAITATKWLRKKFKLDFMFRR